MGFVLFPPLLLSRLKRALHPPSGVVKYLGSVDVRSREPVSEREVRCRGVGR